MLPANRSTFRTVAGFVVLAGVIIAGVLLWVNRLAVADDIRLIGYTPPANISTLASQIQFTQEGQRLFYASHPSIEDKATFNPHCQANEAGQAVLGCYTKDSIYVYNVTDSRLDGVQEVTAAHETLHAAYARLSDSERTTVDGMIQRFYDNKLANDAAFKERFSVYDSLSQADKLNEFHSIFGTEVASLSPELETYYKQYFKDRSIISADYAKYQAPFDALKNEQSNLQTQIDTLKTEIQSSKTQYETDRTALDADIKAFNQKSNSGGYTSQSDFSSDRSALVSRSNALNAEADDINSKIDQYNNAVNQYNSLSIQTEDLQNSLNSQSVQSAPSV